MKKEIIRQVNSIRNDLTNVVYLIEKEIEEQSSLLLELQEKKHPKAMELEKEIIYLEEIQEIINNFLKDIK